MSAVRQKIKDDAVKTLTKPTKVSFYLIPINLVTFLFFIQIVSDAVSAADELTGLRVGTQRALKQIIHVS